MPAPLPALFVSHGAPTTALEPDSAFARDLRAFFAALPRPRAALIVSAHWLSRGPVLASVSEHPETIHDFSGFPRALHELRYPAPGAPAVARRAVALLREAGFAAETVERGLDHGAWTPLVLGLPAADVPATQVSLPYAAAPAQQLALGRALSPLRDEGVLLIGSGTAVHNLRRIGGGDEAWAVAFDRWLEEKVQALDANALASWRDAPSGPDAHPSPDHYDPLLVVVGSARPGERTRTVHAGFQWGTLSMRSFAVEPTLKA